ncbi:unnamed protein product [Penicillium palitans]
MPCIPPHVSTAANVRTAISLGINTPCDDPRKVFWGSQKAEEAQQTWRGITITDRYVSLENGQAPSTYIGRPIEAVEGNKDTEDWAKVETDSFIKLTHASQLLDQALVYVHVTQSYSIFDGVKAVQILQSLTSFMSTFQSGDSNPHPLSDSALALCRSIMLETLEVGSHMYISDNECRIHTSLNILKSLIYEIAQGAETSPPIETATLSVFLPHSIYKAAMMCLHDVRLAGVVDPEPPIRSLKALLGYLGMRWLAARRYLAKIERAQETCNL